MWNIEQSMQPNRCTTLQKQPRRYLHNLGAWWLLCLVTLCSTVLAGLAHAQSLPVGVSSDAGFVSATLVLGAIALVGLRRARQALRTANE